MVSTKLKICLVAPVPPPYGGVARWTTLVQSFGSATANVEFVQVDISPSWRSIFDNGVARRLLGGAVQLVRDYLQFIVTIRQKPDLIHLTTSGSLAVFRDLVIGLTARLWRIPLAYHLHFGRVPEAASTNTLEWRILAWVMRLSAVVMAITPQTVETIKRCRPDVYVEYTPNPIDFSVLPAPVLDCNRERHIAIFLGWTLPTKGVAELVQAWTELHPPDWDLWLVGPGDASYQQDLVRRYEPNNLTFIGELKHDEAMQALAMCDIFVLPSYTEGFPNVILEAMALSKPIVATTVGAIPDMLPDNCGLLVKPRDVIGLRRALSQLIQDPTLRRELGVNAYEKVCREYSIDTVFAQYMRIWQSL